MADQCVFRVISSIIVLWQLYQVVHSETSANHQQNHLKHRSSFPADDVNSSLPAVTLSIRDINDVEIMQALDGDYIQLVLTMKRLPGVPLYFGFQPWRCRAISDSAGTWKEQLVLVDGCGDGEVIHKDGGFSPSILQHEAETELSSVGTILTVRSEYFQAFSMDHGNPLHFTCDMVVVPVQIAEQPSCDPTMNWKRKLVQHRNRREALPVQPTTSGVFTVIPGEGLERKPHLEVIYYYEEALDDATNTPTSSPLPPADNTISLAPTTEPSTLPPTPPPTLPPTLPPTPPTLPPTLPPLTISTTSVPTIATPKQGFTPSLPGQPDVGAAVGYTPNMYYQSVLDSPMIIGLLLGLGVLLFVLIVVAIPTAYLCWRVVSISLYDPSPQLLQPPLTHYQRFSDQLSPMPVKYRHQIPMRGFPVENNLQIIQDLK